VPPKAETGVVASPFASWAQGRRSKVLSRASTTSTSRGWVRVRGDAALHQRGMSALSISRLPGASRRIVQPGAESIEPQGAGDASKWSGHPTPIFALRRHAAGRTEAGANVSPAITNV
jgi:hypothetical protein